MSIQIPDGKALVIVGPQGSGKTLLAQRIASAYGSHKTVALHQLRGEFSFGNVLHNEPDVLIVEDCSPVYRRKPGMEHLLEDWYTDLIQRLKVLITAKEVPIERKMRAPQTVRPPRFILVSGDVNPFPPESNDRRFWVIDASKVK